MKRFSEIIFCVLKMKEGLTVVERHEDASHFLFSNPELTRCDKVFRLLRVICVRS